MIILYFLDITLSASLVSTLHVYQIFSNACKWWKSCHIYKINKMLALRPKPEKAPKCTVSVSSHQELFSVILILTFQYLLIIHCTANALHNTSQRCPEANVWGWVNNVSIFKDKDTDTQYNEFQYKDFQRWSGTKQLQVVKRQAATTEALLNTNISIHFKLLNNIFKLELDKRL